MGFDAMLKRNGNAKTKQFFPIKQVNKFSLKDFDYIQNVYNFLLKHVNLFLFHINLINSIHFLQFHKKQCKVKNKNNIFELHPKMGGGRNIDDQNVDRPKISER